MPPTTVEHPQRRLAGIDYKWIALSHTTLGTLMAALNSSIILIALPAIFRGMQVDPLAPGESPYLLWSLLGYLVVTATHDSTNRRSGAGPAARWPEVGSSALSKLSRSGREVKRRSGVGNAPLLDVVT